MFKNFYPALAVLAVVASIAIAAPPTANKPPVVSLTAPANGSSFAGPATINMTATASDSDGTIAKVEFYRDSILLGSSTVAPYAFTWSNVPANSYSLTAKAYDNAGASTTSAAAGITVNSANALVISSPANGATVNGTSVNVTGTFIGTINTTVLADNGSSSRLATLSGNTFSVNVPIELGTNTLNVLVARADKSFSKASITVNGANNPMIVFTSPTSTLFDAPANVALAVNALSPNGAIEKVSFFNGAQLLSTVSTPPYQFAWNGIPKGDYSITAQVIDNLGYNATASTSFMVKGANLLPIVSLSSPANNSSYTAPATISLAATATDPDGSVSRVEFFQNGILICASNIAPYTCKWSAVPVGSYALTARVTDDVGGQAESGALMITVKPVYAPGPAGVPPDPATLASPIDPTVATKIGASTAFLYTGPNAIQTGVEPGTIDIQRLAVLRGKVMTHGDQPVPGVTIRVLGHPEYGQTGTRADGKFDLVVNGGGYLTLNYLKAGFLSAQRTINTPSQDFSVTTDVVMIPVDTKATAIDLTAATAMQTASGSVVSDADGSRQATLFFPQGTTATMLMPDGTSQALTSITARATEHTVGARGPQTMPGSLPPTSGYTYAAEYSIDEAEAAGAVSVQFNQAIYQYVDNFLNFKVGGIVPAGYYDRQKAAWLPSGNGVVVKILSISGGIATLDTTGTGAPDSAARLAALNITDSERIHLAGFYTAGSTFWRVPLMHLTPWDCNWPVGLPPDARPPTMPEPRDPDLDDCDCQEGSIIEAQNQSLGEVVAIGGTPLHLYYKSSRMPGTNSMSLPIALSGPTLPPGVKSISLEVSIAGRSFALSFAATTNQSHTFNWDGLDAYGRAVMGSQPVSIRVGYVYDGVYMSPSASQDSFGDYGSAEVTGVRARSELTLWQNTRSALNSWHATMAGFGGWTINVQHAYDPNTRTLHLGNGSTRSVKGLNTKISTVAGNGIAGDTGIGGAATAAALSSPKGIAVDSKGALYIATGMYIRKVSPAGVISNYAGSGCGSGVGDGGPAVDACLSSPTGLAFDSQDSLFVADATQNVVRKITSDGIISTVAGSGTAGFGGDGGLATVAMLKSPHGVAVDTQGNLYIADSFNHRIRKVNALGIISTLAGTDGPYITAGPAIQAKLELPLDVAVDTQGNLYVSEFSSGVVRKVSTDGIISTVAGKARFTLPVDGGAATLSGLRPHGIALNAKGELYIADADDNSINMPNSAGNNRIRKVTLDGLIATVAGNGTRGFSGDGGMATAATISSPWTIAFDAQGSWYFSDQNNHRVRKVTPFFPGGGESDFTIPAEDGSELYVFNASGRHLRTLNAVTGAVQYDFTYDANGFLSRITDGDANSTLIERDSAGVPGAIVAPDGQRTTFAFDGNGYLKSITNAANEATGMEYGTGGLLTTFTNPRQYASTMTYRPDGRLIKDKNAAGGFWDLVRTDISSNRHQVSMTTALGRTTKYDTEVLPVGDTRRITTQPDGSLSTTVKKADGTIESTAADGTVATTVIGADPRFGMQVPMAISNIVKLPSGLTSRITSTRSVTLSNPQNLLSLVSSIETTAINDKEFRTTYDAGLRQFKVYSPLNRQNLVTVDVQGRPLKVETTGFYPQSYLYDARGRIQSVSQGAGAELRELSYTYNAEGFPATFTDALKRTTSYSYDAVGRLKTITSPGPEIVAINYDQNGNPTYMTPPGRPIHGFGYNSVDLADSYAPPAVGTALSPTKFTYNLDKQPTKVIRPDGLEVTYAYDAAGRLSSLVAPTGSTSYAYEPGTGRLASVTAPAGVVLGYSYDGALPVQATLSGPIAGNLSFRYDNFLRPSEIGVNGNGISYRYDDDGLLIGAGALSLVRDPVTGSLNESALDQIGTIQLYDSFADLRRFTATHGSIVLFDEEYVHDKIGRLEQKTVTTGGQNHIYKYAYDPAGRLANVTKDGASTGTFTYDENGNRNLAYGISASYDAQDRITNLGGATYSYSDNGELKTIVAGDQITGYDYDVFGNLKHVDLPGGSKLDYLIDGLHRRIGKKIDGVLVQGLLYQDQLKVAAELDGNGNTVSRFVYGGKSNVPEYMIKGGVTYRIITDQLGSVRIVVDSANGQITQRIDYDEWGGVQIDTNPGFQPFGFAGGLYDRDTGLVRFGLRDYEPRAGQWTAKDPIGFRGGSTSLYAYVRGNPLSRIDPSGLADLNLFNPTLAHDYSQYNGANHWNIPNVYTVAGHGNPGIVEDSRSGKIDRLLPWQLAKIIRDDKNWKGKPITLGACNTGRKWPDGYGGKNWNEFAQDLATELGVDVTAPKDFSWYDSQKGMLGSSGPNKAPDKGSIGTWVTFSPRR